MGRYLLSVIDQESELLQIAARTPAGLSDRLDTAYAALVDGLTAELAGWIHSWSPDLGISERDILAALGVNSLLGVRFATNLFRRNDGRIADADYLAEWTKLLAMRIAAGPKT